MDVWGRVGIVKPINIKGLDKAAVLAALYNASRPMGLGALQFTAEDMTVAQANMAIVSRGNLPRAFHFSWDYLKGRVMKVDLADDTFMPGLYDRDNGEGAALRALLAAGLAARYEEEES